MRRVTKKDMERENLYGTFVNLMRYRNKEIKKKKEKVEINYEKFIDFLHWMFDGDFTFNEKVASKYFDKHYESVDNDPDWLTHSNELLDSLSSRKSSK